MKIELVDEDEDEHKSDDEPSYLHEEPMPTKAKSGLPFPPSHPGLSLPHPCKSASAVVAMKRQLSSPVRQGSGSDSATASASGPGPTAKKAPRSGFPKRPSWPPPALPHTVAIFNGLLPPPAPAGTSKKEWYEHLGIR